MGTFRSLAILRCEDDFEGICSSELYSFGQRFVFSDSVTNIRIDYARCGGWLALLFEATTDPSALPLDGHGGIIEAPRRSRKTC